MRNFVPKAAALMAVTLILPLSSCKKKESKTEETPRVEVAYPTVDSVTLYKTLPGTISAGSSVEIVARVNGRILTINYNGGDYVKAGQVLFTIESSKYRDAVQQASAALASAESQYSYYSKQYEAMKKALEANAVSQMDVNQAENSMKMALASINTAKAQLETARTNLSYCTVTSPISGHISDSEFSAGNVVTGEGAPVKLATVYDDAEVKAVFNLADTQYELLMGNGASASDAIYRSIPLKFEQDFNHSYTADLSYTSPSVDATTGTLLLKGVVKNQNNELKDGMFVSVSLPYGVEPHAILVNDASIGTDQLGKYLYVVNDSDKIVYTPIEVGDLYQDTLRLVTKGITDKSRYVTKAILNVRNGETVKPVMKGGK